MKNIDKTINDFIKDNLFKGGVIEIYKNKKLIYQKTYGINKIDNIFRAYSMTKPLTVFGFLLLVEKYNINLNTDIGVYLQEWKNKGIKINHLLTMTSGIMSYWGNDDKNKKQIQNILKTWKHEKWNLKQLSKQISEVDLLFEPGTKWWYIWLKFGYLGTDNWSN